ncbi:hypothetical protein IJ596_02880 [bacterium]|nr:hypothetical protein [bacterium]
MKSVLLVTTYFAPDNTIAAIRTTKLVKYMIKDGYNVDVVAVRNNNLGKDKILYNDVKSVKVKYVENSKQYKSFEKQIYKIFGSIREKKFSDLSDRKRYNKKSGKIEFYPFETAHPWIASVFYGLAMLKEYDLYCTIKDKIKTFKQYDFMVTSYGDEFCYYFGKKYHKIYPETKWIFDVRDAIYRYKFIPDPLSFIPLHIERVAWRQADVIIGISKGICMRVDEKNRKKVHLVTNGYDRGDRIKHDKKVSPDKLTFVFTGSMYGGTIDLSVFFKVLRELIDNGNIDSNKIKIDFAGTESAADIFISQASKYDMEYLIVNHGKVERKSALRLQECADVLLAPSYDYENGNGGIITGKIFEYMTAEKPVIAIITGDIQHSELAEIVRKTNIGFAYEEAHNDIDYKKLYQYVLNLYKEKILLGVLSYKPNIEELKKFDYKYLSKKFMRIMDPNYNKNMRGQNE